jgi:hypothetical protein
VNDDYVLVLATTIPLSIITAGVIIILMAMRQRSQTMELKHRERMAMIERGIVPGASSDLVAFERVHERHDAPPGRPTSLGVIVVALGLGFMLLVGFAAEAPGPAVGIGGATVVLGLAFILNGELQRRARPLPGRHDRPLPPLDSSGPPGSLGP